MIEEAALIHDYLPIRRSQFENDYITYLWNSFDRLATSDDAMSASFSVTAFHLLFMLAVQYKALRVFKEKPEEYRHCFTVYKPHEKKVMAPESVFDLSLLRESDVFHLFELIGVSDSCIGNCKQIVKKRNNEFMHASGNQPNDIETHVSNCIRQLATIQTQFTAYNDALAHHWSHEMTSEDDPQEFVELNLYNAQLTNADFSEGKLNQFFGFAVGQ